MLGEKDLKKKLEDRFFRVYTRARPGLKGKETMLLFRVSYPFTELETCWWGDLITKLRRIIHGKLSGSFGLKVEI